MSTAAQVIWDNDPAPQRPAVTASADTSQIKWDDDVKSPTEQPGFFGRLSQQVFGTQHPLDQAISEGKQLYKDPIGTLKETAKDVAMTPVNLANRALPIGDAMGAAGKGDYTGAAKTLAMGPLNLARDLSGGPQAGADAEAGNWKGLAGTLLGDVLQSATMAHGMNQSGEAVSPSPSADYTKLQKASGLYRRAVAPGSLSAEDEAAMQQNFGRAARYIAPEVQQQAVKGGPGGAMRAAQVADNASDKLWSNTVQPVVERFRDVQADGSDVANSIRNSFGKLDAVTNPSKVEAGKRLAEAFDQPLSVGEMADAVTQLNNDKAVSRYYSLSPVERSQAEMADPALQAKVAAVNGLRTKLFDTIAEAGGDDLGQDFQTARKDFGALRTVAGDLGGTKIPAPKGWPTRLANTVRGIWRPEYWATQETLGMFNNPNRLAASALNTLGDTGLTPPKVDLFSMPSPRTPPGQLSLDMQQGPLFDVGNTPRTPLEFSRGDLFKIEIPIDEALETLNDPNATAKDKALAQQKLQFMPAVRNKFGASPFKRDQ